MAKNTVYLNPVTINSVTRVFVMELSENLIYEKLCSYMLCLSSYTELILIVICNCSDNMISMEYLHATTNKFQYHFVIFIDDKCIFLGVEVWCNIVENII